MPSSPNQVTKLIVEITYIVFSKSNDYDNYDNNCCNYDNIC